MSATEVTHKFFALVPLWVGKVGAGGVASASATTIPTASMAGLTNGQAYVITANRVNATGTTKNPANERETFIGKVSGSDFINSVRQLEGQAQAWEADTVLEVLVTATVWNKLIEGIEVEHNDDGTHSDITADTVETTSLEINSTGPIDKVLPSTATDGELDDDEALVTGKKIKEYVNTKNLVRTTTEVSSATPTINTDNTDIHTITALATAITSMTTNLSGTPVNGQKLILRFKDDGTARGIAHGASFASRGATLLTTTTLGKYSYEALIWNSTTSTWDCVAVVTEA